LATEGPTGALEAVVLAGGAGRRFGGGKLTAPWRGGALLDGALAAAFAAPVRGVTLAFGDDARVPAAARAFAARIGAGARLTVVRAERASEGIAETLKAAIAALPADCAGAFVFLGDMPRVPHAILPALAQALTGGTQAAAPAFEGARGHPVLFAASLFPELARLGGDRGAASVLASLGERLALVPTEDAGVLFDVDRPEDLAN
jgi:molybdenum cofactor cytidylyltransferase